MMRSIPSLFKSVLFLSFLVGLSSTLYAEERLPDTSTRTISFLGISLQSTPEEVRALKGQPDEVSDNTWLYRKGIEPDFYVVGFSSDRVSYVIYWSDRLKRKPSLLGIYPGASKIRLIRKLGVPDQILPAKDEKSVILRYSKHNAHFFLLGNRITAIGIYDPKVKEDAL